MRIIDASESTGARARCSRATRAADRAFERRVARHRRRACARAATARCSRFARRFDGVAAAARSVAPTRCAPRPRACRPTCAARSAQAARNIARVASRQIPKHFDVDGRARRVGRAARRAARARRLLRAGRTLSAALVAADDRRPGARRRRPRDHRRLSAARAGRDGGGARSRRHAAVPRRRRARDRRARVRHRDASRAWTRSSGPGNRYVAAAKALRRRPTARSTSTPARPRSSSSPAAGAPDWIAADLVAQAEHDPDARSIFITWSRALAERVAAARRARAPPAATSSQRSLAAHGAVDRDAIGRRGDGAGQPDRARTPGRRSRGADSTDRSTAGAVFVGPFTAQAAGDYATGSNHVLPTAGAARFRGGLSAADFVRVMSVQRVTRAGLARLAPTILPLARAEGLRGARRVDRGAAAMSKYQKPAELYDGLRLHQNENTGGCSPRVLEALRVAARRADRRSIRRTQAATEACAALSRRRPPIVCRSSTASTKASWRIGGRATCGRRPAASVPEAIIPEPAFEIFAFDTEVVGGTAGARRCRSPTSAFRSTRCSRRSRRSTRVVFLTNPNNPTGVAMPLEAIRDDRAARAAGARSCSSTRRTPSSAGADVHSRARRVSERRSSAGRSRRRSAWPACASAPRRRTRTTLDPIRLRHAGLQRQHRRGRRRAGRARRIATIVERLPAAGRTSRRRCSTPRAIGSG